MGAYRSLFLIEMSNAARNFSIEDGVYVARSQKSLKVGEKFSVEKWKIMVLSKWALFFSSSLLQQYCIWYTLLYRYYIDTLSILYRYSIDTGSIQHQYGLRKSKDRAKTTSDKGLWGRKTETQASFGVDPGSLQEDPGVTQGVREGHQRPPAGEKKKVHFQRFKIMKLCGNLNLLLKRLEID